MPVKITKTTLKTIFLLKMIKHTRYKKLRLKMQIKGQV